MDTDGHGHTGGRVGQDLGDPEGPGGPADDDRAHEQHEAAERGHHERLDGGAPAGPPLGVVPDQEEGEDGRELPEHVEEQQVVGQDQAEHRGRRTRRARRRSAARPARRRRSTTRSRPARAHRSRARSATITHWRVPMASARSRPMLPTHGWTSTSVSPSWTAAPWAATHAVPANGTSAIARKARLPARSNSHGDMTAAASRAAISNSTGGGPRPRWSFLNRTGAERVIRPLEGLQEKDGGWTPSRGITPVSFRRSALSDIMSVIGDIDVRGSAREAPLHGLRSTRPATSGETGLVLAEPSCAAA